MVYSTNLTASINEFYWGNVKLDSGYLDAQLYCEGHIIELCFSYIYEPFSRLIKWLEEFCQKVVNPEFLPKIFEWYDEHQEYTIKSISLSKEEYVFELCILGWSEGNKQCHKFVITVPTVLFLQQMVNLFSQINSVLIYKKHDFFDVESREITTEDGVYFVPFKVDFIIEALETLLLNKNKNER